MRVLRGLIYSLICVVMVLFLIYLFLPRDSGEQIAFDDPHQKPRKSVTSDSFMASTGTPWATDAAIKILEKGGNAFDAGMAALLALNVTYPEAASFPSVAPALIYEAETGNIRSYCGAGTAPENATIDYFLSKGHDTMPDMGILAQLLPASPDVIVSILDEYGTMHFEEISREAIRLAEEGFPVHSMLIHHFDLSVFERFGYSIIMPYNVKVYLNGEWWRSLRHKDRFKQPDLARTLKAMARAEKKVIKTGGSRSEGLKAVRDYFYKGPIADTIAKLHEEEGGLITRKDLEQYKGYWEKPLTGRYGDYTIHVNGTWSQGAVLPMALQILEGTDLGSMKRNSPETIHTMIQAVELAMADREAYFGDPDFIRVPIDGLLSKKYAAIRRKSMTPEKAFGEMPPSGKPDRMGGIQSQPVDVPFIATVSPMDKEPDPWFSGKLDTSYLAVTDSLGNSISMTPSDFPLSPMIPDTGLCLGIRMTQFRLNPNHPAALKPGKRPRITPNACMVTKNGKLFMTFGTPESDQQPQALVQVFINLIVYGMDIQEAIDAPRFRSRNFPDSFSPHTYRPGSVLLEKSLYDKVGKPLEKMGYDIEAVEDWHYEMGAVGAIIRDETTGRLIGGADPRQENWADGK